MTRRKRMVKELESALLVELAERKPAPLYVCNPIALCRRGESWTLAARVWVGCEGRLVEQRQNETPISDDLACYFLMRFFERMAQDAQDAGERDSRVSYAVADRLTDRVMREVRDAHGACAGGAA